MEIVNKDLFDKLQAGRKHYQNERTRLRLEKEGRLFDEGKLEVGKLSEREIFIAGITLYWAEGFKHKDESGLGLATLDVKMAKFYISWLEKCLKVDKNNLLFRVTANKAYEDQVGEMEKWWANELEVEISQFAKPFFQKTRQLRVYANSDSYHGVIRIRVRKSLDLLRKMRGWMAGLALIAS